MVLTLFRPWDKKQSDVGWRVRILLAEKKILYETRLILPYELNSEEILQMNPRGELPIVQDVDAVVHEEIAILMYIQTLYAETGTVVMPPLDQRKAYAEAMVLFAEAVGPWSDTVKTTLNLFSSLSQQKGKIDQDQLKRIKAAMAQELARWERILESSEGSFLHGKDISLSDIVFFTPLVMLVRHGLNLGSKYSKLNAYYTMMCERESISKTWPEGWKDENVPQWLKDL